MTAQQIRNYSFRGKYIPEHMIGGVLRYFNDHILPGNFLQALLEDRFMRACKSADDENIEALQVWASFLYNMAPNDAFGSPEKVEAWVQERQA